MADCIIAVRLDDARDFVVDPSGLSIAPSSSDEFPIGCRVRITDIEKCFPKSEELAESLLLGKWTSEQKPLEGSIGTVLSSVKHPSAEDCIVLGVRTEVDSRDFAVDVKGVAKAPQVSKEFPEGAQVRVKLPDKVYTKMEGVAKELTLSKWAANTSAQEGEVGVVFGSTSHPSEADQEVIGFRTGKGQDFVIAPEGLELVQNVSEKFTVGTRVYIANPDKLYPKMSDVAQAMNLTRWTSGSKPIVPPAPKAAAVPADENGEPQENPTKKRKISRPLMTCAGEVRGSATHPSGSGIVVGVRTETGQEFLVGEEGLALAPQQHPEFKAGTRVKVTDVGKVYPKFDEKAYQLHLTRWVNGEKPAAVLTGKVLGSVEK